MFIADAYETTAVRPAPAAPTMTATRTLPAEDGSVPALRRFARRAVSDWALPDSVDEAVALVVTELASNAVRHSGSPDVTLRVSLSRRAVTVEVKDHGQWRALSPAERLSRTREGVSGRGLSLVRAYVAGCILWCESDGTRAVARIALPHAPR